MGKSGVKNDAFANSGVANNLSSTNFNNSQGIYGSLVPELQATAAHPAGFTPQAKAAMGTAAQQSAGGANAGAVGQGALLASRTRNAGTADAAIQQSARNASQQLGKAAVGTEVANAGLQNEQQTNAQRELAGIGGTELGASNQALGLSNQALGVANGVKPPFWQQVAGGILGNATYSKGGLTV